MTRKVIVHIERWEVLGLERLQHWCTACKAMHEFHLNEQTYSWHGPECGHVVLIQQLIIEGRLSEGKYMRRL
jgi:hypothetical protein